MNFATIKKKLMFALRGDWSCLLGRHKEMGFVVWHCVPPANTSLILHNFSIVDAIETASMFLETDYAREREWIVAHQYGRKILASLPQFVEAEVDGLYPQENGMVLMGKLGARKVYYRAAARPEVLCRMVLFNENMRCCHILIDDTSELPMRRP